jgi:hypothetical protein
VWRSRQRAAFGTLRSEVRVLSPRPLLGLPFFRASKWLWRPVMPEIQGSFAALLARPDAHVVFDLSLDSQTLLVLFGGIAGGVSIPVFEFFRVSEGYPSQRVFLRDPRRSWYQLGIPGVGDSAVAVKSLLDETIDRSGAQRVVMAGASAGGFAAMLFGDWCGADATVAFSPQTFIDARNRERTGDDRWQEQIDALHGSAGGRDVVLDLLTVLPTRDGKTQHHIHVSTDDRLDMIHAQRMAGCPGVEIVEHVDGGHRLVKTLRDRGLLRPVMLQALAATVDLPGAGAPPSET